MSNISQLENFISTKRTYDEVLNEAKSIDKLWRSATWERGLRNSKKIQGLKRDSKQNSPIIAYTPINDIKTPQIKPSQEVLRSEKLDGTQETLFTVKPKTHHEYN